MGLCKSFLSLVGLIAIGVLVISSGGSAGGALAATPSATAAATRSVMSSGLPVISVSNASNLMPSKILTSAATGPSWSPDGKLLATILLDIFPSVQLYTLPNLDTPARKIKLTSSGSERVKLTTIVFSPDSKLLAVGGYIQSKGGQIWLVDVATGKPLTLLQGHKAEIFKMAFSDDSKTLATAGDQTVILWNVATGAQKGTLRTECNKTGYTGVAYNADLTWIAIGCLDGSIEIWEPLKLFIQRTVPGNRIGPAVDLAFTADRSLIAVAGKDKTVRIWQLSTRRQLASFDNEVYSLAFTPDGTILAGGGIEGSQTIWLWDVQAGKQLAALTHNSGAVKGIQFSPDGTQLVSDHSGTVIVWSVGRSSNTGSKATTQPTVSATAAATTAKP